MTFGSAEQSSKETLHRPDSETGLLRPFAVLFTTAFYTFPREFSPPLPEPGICVMMAG